MLRSDAEAYLTSRLGKSLIRVGKDGTTKNGTNADLAQPISYTLSLMGFSVASLASPGDGDLSSLAQVQYAEFYARASSAVLDAIVGWCDEVDEKGGTQSQALSQFAKQIQAQLDRLDAKILARWGDAPSVIVFGTMTEGTDRGAGGLLPYYPPPNPLFPIG